ncbi:MAG: tail fiber protein [Alphaproteobacteria bacterium]|nr:tail fiber protein [Alphaproteobacteria bacterium]
MTIFSGGGNSGVKAGSLLMWATNTPPEGYLLCDGSAVSRTTYSELFKVIGTTFGAGNGSTTFNLPTLKIPDGAGNFTVYGDGNALRCQNGAGQLGYMTAHHGSDGEAYPTFYTTNDIVTTGGGVGSTPKSTANVAYGLAQKSVVSLQENKSTGLYVDFSAETSNITAIIKY